MAQILKLKAYFDVYYQQERQAEHDANATGSNHQDGDHNDSDSDEEDDDFPDLEEHEAVLCGAPQLKNETGKARERFMHLKKVGADPKGGRLVKVKGKFLLDGPWWDITFDAMATNNAHYQYECIRKPRAQIRCLPPTYALRREQGVRGLALLDRLLILAFDSPAAGTAGHQLKESIKSHFLSVHASKRWVQYTFHQFFTVLEALVKKNAKKRKDDSDPTSGGSAMPIVQAAMHLMNVFNPYPSKGSEEVNETDNNNNNITLPEFDLRLVYRCYRFPRLFELLPRLLEKRALSVLQTRYTEDLKCLDHVLKTQPTDFGYYTSMRRHGWGTIEATFQGFIDTGFIRPSNPDPADLGGSSSSKHLFSPGTVKALLLYDILKSECQREGHTFLRNSNLEFCWKRRGMFSEFPHDLERAQILGELCENRRVMDVDWSGQGIWQLTKYKRYEQSVAGSLRTLDLKDPCLVKGFREEEEDASCNYDDGQKEAARSIRNNSVSIILGRGGCGKTHVVTSVIKAATRARSKKQACDKNEDKENAELGLEVDGEGDKDKEKLPVKDEGPEVDLRLKQWLILAAPTGRAAAIMKKRTGLPANTLHSIISSARNAAGDGFVYSNVEVLVVDECSMVALSVIAEVLRVLVRHKLRKVVFLGDQHQLPSIDPGNFLEDIISVFQRIGRRNVTTLTVNHRVDPGGRLIVNNAGRIAERKAFAMLEWGELFELVPPATGQGGQGGYGGQRDQRGGLGASMQSLYMNKPCLRDAAKSQVIAFTNAYVKGINEVCCHLYAKHFPFNRGKPNYRPGDKICTKKNTTIWAKRSSPQKSPEDHIERERKEASDGQEREGGGGDQKREGGSPGQKLCPVNNGDIFFIKSWKDMTHAEGRREEIVELQSMDEEEGNIMEVDFKRLKKKSKVNYAWARTIHTFQGSETDYIVYVISSSNAESWKHLYTAITRGKKGCFIVGTEPMVRKVLKKNPVPRKTRLQKFLTDALAGQNQGLQPSPLATDQHQAHGSSCGQVQRPIRQHQLIGSPVQQAQWSTQHHSGNNSPAHNIHHGSLPGAQESMLMRNHQGGSGGNGSLLSRATPAPSCQQDAPLVATSLSGRGTMGNGQGMVPRSQGCLLPGNPGNGGSSKFLSSRAMPMPSCQEVAPSRGLVSDWIVSNGTSANQQSLGSNAQTSTAMGSYSGSRVEGYPSSGVTPTLPSHSDAPVAAAAAPATQLSSFYPLDWSEDSPMEALWEELTRLQDGPGGGPSSCEDAPSSSPTPEPATLETSSQSDMEDHHEQQVENHQNKVDLEASLTHNSHQIPAPSSETAKVKKGRLSRRKKEPKGGVLHQPATSKAASGNPSTDDTQVVPSSGEDFVESKGTRGPRKKVDHVTPKHWDNSEDDFQTLRDPGKQMAKPRLKPAKKRTVDQGLHRVHSRSSDSCNESQRPFSDSDDFEEDCRPWTDHLGRGKKTTPYKGTPKTSPFIGSSRKRRGDCEDQLDIGKNSKGKKEEKPHSRCPLEVHYGLAHGSNDLNSRKSREGKVTREDVENTHPGTQEISLPGGLKHHVCSRTAEEVSSAAKDIGDGQSYSQEIFVSGLHMFKRRLYSQSSVEGSPLVQDGGREKDPFEDSEDEGDWEMSQSIFS